MMFGRLSFSVNFMRIIFRWVSTSSTNVIGLEIGGSAKNVFAMAAGMCKGLWKGMNAMADLVTRRFGEMRQLGVKLGTQPTSIIGLLDYLVHFNDFFVF